MIDGTKLRIPERAQRRLRSHARLAGLWRSRGQGRAGSERYTARWKGWTFTGDATRCWEVRGSFHKVHHGGTNWQDYTGAQFAHTVAALCDAFGLHDAGLTLAGLEIGANIVPPIPTAEVLRSIVLHKNARPVAMRRGHGIEIVHAGYRFKIYDKAAQYPQHVTGELLRVEVKVSKMRTLARCHVRTVADLLDPAAWTRLRAFLLAKFDELLIAEPKVATDGLRPAQRDLVAKAADPSYWHAMPRQRRSERRRTLAALYTRHASPNLKATLRALIAAKLEELNDGPTPDVCTKGTPEPDPGRLHQGDTPPRTFAPFTIRGANVRVAAKAKAPAEVGMMPPAPPARRCLSCGRDISHQDPRSRVCSERIHGKAGKACRNKLSNRSLTLRRMAARGGLLFDQRPFVAVATSNPPHAAYVNPTR